MAARCLSCARDGGSREARSCTNSVGQCMGCMAGVYLTTPSLAMSTCYVMLVACQRHRSRRQPLKQPVQSRCSGNPGGCPGCTLAADNPVTIQPTKCTYQGTGSPPPCTASALPCPCAGTAGWSLRGPPAGVDVWLMRVITSDLSMAWWQHKRGPALCVLARCEVQTCWGSVIPYAVPITGGGLVMASQQAVLPVQALAYALLERERG
jgi:hypothetical protein